MSKQTAEYFREYRRTHPNYRKREADRVARYWKEHPEKKREQWEKFKAKHGTKRRVAARVAAAKNAILKRGNYSPRPWMRLPEWMPVGGSCIDVRSPWLINNLTDSQRAYARELAIERKAQREA